MIDDTPAHAGNDRRMKRALVLALIGATAIGASCTQVSSDPNLVVALAFDSLPYSAVVIGDTLRTEAGVAVPLRASALNVNGDVVASAVVKFFSVDSGAAISPSGFLVATNPASTSLQLVAQVGTLQSRALNLFVTARPDSIAQEGVVDTLRYVTPDDATNTSAPIVIHVWSNTAVPPVSVNGWIVHYTVSYHGQVLPSTDVTRAWFVDDNGNRAADDTTGGDGLASRRVRVISTGLVATGLSGVDTVTVTATAIARGAPLVGSPLSTLIPLVAARVGSVR